MAEDSKYQHVVKQPQILTVMWMIVEPRRSNAPVADGRLDTYHQCLICKPLNKALLLGTMWIK